MSHFSVLVFGPNVEEQLAPYHEFECTGEDNQYVVDVDETEDRRAQYEESTETMVVNSVTGERFSAYDDRCYRDPTPEESAKIGPLGGSGCAEGISFRSGDWGDGHRHTKVRYLPEGFTEQEVPTREIQTFLEYLVDDGCKPLRSGEPRTAEHKYGFVEINEAGEVVRVVDRTNPNKKWDWFQIGGRWSDSLRLKPGATGKHGNRSWTNERAPSKPSYCDQAKLGDIDFDAERDVAGEQAGKNHDRWMAAIAEQPRPRSWTEIREENEGDIDRAREIYNAQPAILASKRAEYRDFMPWFECPVQIFGFDRAAYIERKRLGAIVPYAFVHEGKWHGKGEMGWFGCSHDEKGSDDDWARFVHDYMSKLSPDTLVTMVDCHI